MVTESDKVTSRAASTGTAGDNIPLAISKLRGGAQPEWPDPQTPGMANKDQLTLLVTGQPTDAQALQAALAAAGLSASLERIDNLAALRERLVGPGWQLLVAYAGADLSPPEVLHAAGELALGRPVVVVAQSDSLDEARSLMRNGAIDIVQVEHLSRLPLAIEKALAVVDASTQDEYYEMFFRNQAIQFLVNPTNGKIADANRAAVQFYGYERAALLGMSVLQLSLEPERAAVRLNELAGGRQGAVVTRHRLASGAVRDVEVHSNVVTRAGRKLLYAIVHDITDRLQRERELETVAKFAAALRTAPNRAAMLPVILEQVQALVGADGAALVLRDPVGSGLVVALAHGWPDASGTQLPDSSLAGQVAATGQPEWRLAVPAGVQAAAPLVAQGNALGAVCVSLTAAPTTLQVRLLSAIADMTANALQRTTLHEQTEQRMQRLAALHAIDLAITSSFDLRMTLGILLNHLLDQLQVGGAAILLLNSATQTLEYAAVRGLNAALMHQSPLRLNESLAGRVAATGQPLQINDLPAERIASARPYHIGSQKFTSYYGLPLLAKGRTQGVLEILQRGPLPTDADSLEYLESLATQAAIAIDGSVMFSDLQRSNVDLNLAYDATIEGWSRVLEARGIESPGHTRRVADLTVKLAQAAGFGGVDLLHARHGALLHDIGMLAVPEAVLLKPGPLNETEQMIMRQHPEHGFEFLAPINYLRPSLDIPYGHHEKWDGSGYPRGLRGDHIPVAARVFALVDTWDALRADRPFRAAWTAERALAHIKSRSGSDFDPKLTEVFLRIATSGKR